MDDEEAITEEIVEYLGGKGIAAVAAGEAKTALAQVLGDPSITVMLTDVRMPGTDGMALAAQALAGRTDEQALEVVVLTGHASLDMVVDAVRTRVFDFVRKPVLLRDIVETIGRAHAAAQSRRMRSRSLAARATALAGEARALRARIESLTAPGAGPARGAPQDAQVLALINDELRTPLVPILGLAEMIERDAGQLSEERLMEYGALIRQSGERLRDIAESFATLSALDLGAAKPNIAPERAASILGTLRMRHEAASRQRGQMLVVSVEGDGMLETDRGMLVQALDQLVANAIRFSPTGGEIRLLARREAGGDVFRVADSGPGMTTAQAQEAMRPFRQLDMTFARQHRGLGLGLTLAGRLIEALGGRLDIASAPGQGTEVSVVLPRAGAGQDG